MENVLSTRDLCKNYGKAHVLRNVTLEIPTGSIFGLVGRNGAGKTTLMRILTGLAEPTSGTYSLGGIKSSDRKILTVRRRMGSIIESPAIYKNLSAYDNLKLQYINLGMTSFDTINDLLDLVELNDTGKKKAGKFSLGMRQRLGIAVALCGNPDILILDEPINGLDPQGIIQMREILLRINHEKHTTILISSHILEELSKLATHYAFIEKGEILQTLSSSELMSKVRKASRLKVSSTELLCPVFDREGIDYKVEDDADMDIYSDITASRIISLANEAGVEVVSITENNESLEGYFMNLVAKKDGIS
ncbi:ABC transporter ATP-binding protein [Butyrivibrio sp. AE2032]|uniref:ABC transporter ATP-binding protein n=1 Tax=Butyrivibrio sp. AE2032 TaxID=1458463 RepID=UPI0005503B39|nr:ABC transporter ATP-binding protein [Butyrivibrio sp. AE2032]